MDGPMVSVIVPNFNHDRHLGQRLSSILNQTFQDFEIIILDDCSTDNSRNIIEKFRKHEKVSAIIYNERNSGSPFLQWKNGVSHAQGTWIWIAESDDYAHPSFLERMLAAATAHPNTGLAYCDSAIVESDEVQTETFASLKNRNFGTSRWSRNYTNSGKDEIENYLLAASTINNSSAVLFNRQVLLKQDVFDIPLRYIGDKYAFIKVLACSDVVYVSDTLNYFRDPFNTKHADRFIRYFYEQFLVFDWVYRNIPGIDESRFFRGFHANTRNSLVRGWNREKIALYARLFRVNPYLMTRCTIHNLREGIMSGFAKRQPLPLNPAGSKG